MTIRRNVDVSLLNDTYMLFERGCDRSADGTFLIAKNIRETIGRHCDEFLADMRDHNVKTSNCDGIREIEVMMFGMIAAENREGAIGYEIDTVVGLGAVDDDLLPASLRALERAFSVTPIRPAVNDV